jgi:hypothetical protein
MTDFKQAVRGSISGRVIITLACVEPFKQKAAHFGADVFQWPALSPVRSLAFTSSRTVTELDTRERALLAVSRVYLLHLVFSFLHSDWNWFWYCSSLLVRPRLDMCFKTMLHYQEVKSDAMAVLVV